MYTANELKVLNLLHALDKDTPLNSIKFKDIIKHNDEENIISPKLSVSTVRRSLKKFINEGYIKEGVKKFNNKTYYISSKGISFIENEGREE